MADKRPVLFDQQTFEEDLGHASDAGRLVAASARRRIAGGLDISAVRECDAEGPDGTRLSDCVKLRLPDRPDGQWAMVLRNWTTGSGARVYIYLAFGRRHPTKSWEPSVYELAHRRLHRQR